LLVRVALAGCEADRQEAFELGRSGSIERQVGGDAFLELVRVPGIARICGASVEATASVAGFTPTNQELLLPKPVPPHQGPLGL
jgi:hypothetical protein